MDLILQFRCPHCREVLKINAKYLGQTGACKRCGGRIALVGHENPDVVQTASLVDDGAGVKDQRPATEAQRTALEQMGVPPERAASALRYEVTTMIQQARTDLQDLEPPTSAQLELLRRMGMSDEERARVGSKADASHLIDSLQSKPTEAQMQYLKHLGASASQMTAASTRSAAGELIEKLLRQS